MGRASSSKKVSRAARAAGRPGASRNLVWPLTIGAVVLVGIALIVVSIPEDRAAASPPRIGDHWHAAYGVYLCGSFEEPMLDAGQDAEGIHTHADGLIHIHPFSSRVTGDGANLAAFGRQVDMELEDESLKLPGREVLENGDDCGGRPGVVQVQVFENSADTVGRPLEGDFADFAPQDGEMVTIAFLPEGEEVPPPPSANTVPTDIEQPTPVEPGTEDEPVPSTTPGDESTTTTTAPADGDAETTTTTAPAG
jgi:hypothetical protein